MASTHIPDSGRFPYYERHLPHQHPEGFPLFFTWNLKGAVPARLIVAVKKECLRLQKEPLRPNESLTDRKIRHGKLLFVFQDRRLDVATDGPLHLKDPAAARIVVDSILFGAPVRYDLYAFVVMGNHVHVLIVPHWEPKEIMQPMKGFTSFEINKLQEQPGRVFWQDESYDHWARDEEEMHRIIAYIENNPVVAGLCSKPEEWPWSSASMRANWPIGKPWVRPA